MNGTDDGTPEIGHRPSSTETLQESLIQLSASTALQGQMTLKDSLRRVAGIAVQAIPGAEGVGVTLLEGPGRPDTMVASSQFVQDVDAIQYGMGEGPCITAAATAKTVTSASLSEDPQWPRFGPAVQLHGVNSVLSLPLQRDGHVIGAMNVYARPRNAFNLEAIMAGEAFAIPAAISIQNAHILARGRELATDLNTASINRKVIDQAVGILMERHGTGLAAALIHLHSLIPSPESTLTDTARLFIAAATTGSPPPDPRG